MKRIKDLATIDDVLPDEGQLTPQEQLQSWYELAAITDGNEAHASMCKVYNPDQSPEWYLSAANRGDKYACYTLGKMYYWGVFAHQNYTKAAMYFAKASDADISFADYELAKMCANGLGLEPDQDTADKLFIKACSEFQKQEERCPNSNIEYKLAAIYENGLAGETDLNLAQYWRNLACNSNKELVEESPIPPASQPDEPQKTEAIKQEPVITVLPKLPKKQRSAPIQMQLKKDRKNEKKNRKVPVKPAANETSIQDFLGMIAPSVTDFGHQDYFICGNTFRSVWAIREYPTATSEYAILRDFGEMDGITLKIFARPLSSSEENKIIEKSHKRNRSKKNNTTKVKEKIEAEEDLNDVEKIIRQMHEKKEGLFHCAVFIEMVAKSYKELRDLQEKVIFACTKTKIVYDRLWLLQKEGFQTVMLTGSNQFKSQFERVLPASSVANLYPFSYSGKTDPDGMFIGQDVSGSNIIVNFDRRAPDKTNGHILILGNSGEGKSYLLKLLITNFRQAHKRFYVLDPDDEYKDLTIKLGGCYYDGRKIFHQCSGTAPMDGQPHNIRR